MASLAGMHFVKLGRSELLRGLVSPFLEGPLVLRHPIAERLARDHAVDVDCLVEGVVRLFKDSRLFSSYWFIREV